MLLQAGPCPKLSAEHQARSWPASSGASQASSPSEPLAGAQTGSSARDPLCPFWHSVCQADLTERFPGNQRCERSQFTRSAAQLREQLSQGLGSAERCGYLCSASGITDLSGTRRAFNRSFRLFPPQSCCSYSSSQPPKRCDHPSCCQLTQPKAG